MLAKRCFLAALLLVLLLAGQAQASGRAISLRALKNFTYSLPDQSCGYARIKLQNGLYEGEGNRAVFGRAAFGDLNGDGLVDAAVHLGWQPDGYEAMQHIVFICQYRGRLVQVADYCLDDNETINQMTVASGKLVLESDIERQDLAASQPDCHKVTEFRLKQSIPKSCWHLSSQQFQVDPQTGKRAPWVDLTGYVCAVQERLQRNWQPTDLARSQTVTGSFELNRQGQVSALKLETSSELPSADASALEAVLLSQPFAPLPPGANQNLHVSFRMDAGAVTVAL